jgi:integrase
MAGRAGHRSWGHVRKERSGRWSASYLGPDGKRHRAPMTYEKRGDADGWLVDERRALERDSRGVEPWTAPAERHADRWAQGESLADYGKRWITERAGLRPRSRALYESQFGHHIEPDLGTVAVRQMTPERVRAWYAALGTDHPTRNRQVYSLLRSILGTAVKDGLLAANPCQITRVSAPRKREPIILEASEVGALADAMHDERYRALVLLSAWCGLRWGEVSELRRRDVGAACETLTVARAVSGKHIELPKSGKARTVVIPPHIRASVKHHLDGYVGAGDDALLFPGTLGGETHTDSEVFRRMFNLALASIGREGVRVHDLRHFCGTRTAQVGGTVAETMRRLGHSTVSASMTYQAALDQRDVEIAEKLSKLAGH